MPKDTQKLKEPVFGSANKAPPSWFARIPTGAIMDLRITDKEFRAFAVLCSYANNQGFSYPNQKTIWQKSGQHLTTTRKALEKVRKKGYLQIVSTYRSHPKWRHVMGNVYRIVFDKRVTQDDLIDQMNREDPAPIDEKDIPLQSEGQRDEVILNDSKQDDGVKVVELVEIDRLAQHYIQRCNAFTGQLRIKNERSLMSAKRALESHDIEVIKAEIEARLLDCQQNRKDCPHDLGWILKK